VSSLIFFHFESFPPPRGPSLTNFRLPSSSASFLFAPKGQGRVPFLLFSLRSLPLPDPDPLETRLWFLSARIPPYSLRFFFSPVLFPNLSALFISLPIKLWCVISSSQILSLFPMDAFRPPLGQLLPPLVSHLTFRLRRWDVQLRTWSGSISFPSPFFFSHLFPRSPFLDVEFPPRGDARAKQ